MRKASRIWIAIGIGLLASILAINAGVAYQNTRRVHDSAARVAHTHEVMDALESLFSTVKDAETGQRGYLITGEEAYLRPYTEAVARYRAELEQVARLTADNDTQQERVDLLRAAIDQRLEILAKTVELRQQGDFESARKLIVEGAGQKLMRTIRELVGEMKDSERTLLVQRQAADETAYRSALVAIAVAAIAGGGGILAFLALLRKHLNTVVEFTDTLYEKQELLEATLASIGDGVIATDAEGNVTFLNGVARDLTGWTDADAAGRSLSVVFNIVNEETRETVENPALRALREGRIVGLANHTVLLSKKGVEWPIDDSAAPIRAKSGKVRGAILVFREIRERKRQEDELREQALALAEADRQKDEFLATLAHELRNPLSPISNAVQLWPLVEDNREELTKLRGIVERQVQQMTRLVDDLLDLSRISRGQIQIRRQQVDLAAVIDAAVESVQPIVDERGHRLLVDLPAEPIRVDVDVARLTQVFGNILNNAAKYSDNSGTIQVTVRRDQQSAIVSIRDNGPGIPAHMLDEIFEMFRQVDRTLERSHGGLGIGLTLVKRIVAAHGGVVVAKSDGPGQGSEFVVSLPLAEGSSSETARPNAAQDRLPLPRRRVLVIDDVESSAQTLALLLQALSQDATALTDAARGIDWAIEHRPDVVFLDIAMPKMSGYEVAGRLREKLPQVFLVALTGYGQDEDRKRAFESGFNQHLVKPASVDALKNVLRQAGGAA
jgi:PAS domain S-box-containing protein